MKNQDPIMCRDLAAISMFNPLYALDYVELDGPNGGEVWIVRIGGYGWQLRAVSDNRLHPTIHDIQGMSDFISAILEASKQ